MTPDRNRTCVIDGCEKPRKGRGDLCSMHSSRKQRNGCAHKVHYEVGAGEKFLREHADHRGDACLVWPFGSGSDGYGKVDLDGRKLRAHNAMCRLSHGEPVGSKRLACHRCGNRKCVNPEHLYWGTAADNSRDGKRLDEIPIGEQRWNAKLTENDVLFIRRNTHIGRPKLAEMLGVSRGTITAVVLEKSWRHLL